MNEMKLWTTKFHRSNFNFGRKIEQTADVVFECDSEDNTDLWDAAWAAMRDQTGWSDQRLPLDQGWSSVLGGFEFERIEVPHIEDEVQYPSEGKPVIACSFSYNGNTYRANSFYRLHRFFKTFDLDNVHDQLSREMDIEEGNDPDRERYRLIKCLPEDADFVSGSGVAGCIAPINKIKVGDLVQWDDVNIKQAQGEYADKIANYTEDQIMMDNFQLGPYIHHYVKELES